VDDKVKMYMDEWVVLAMTHGVESAGLNKVNVFTSMRELVLLLS
jgi:hypothetical protein